ncbi:GDP-L-fucose synthase family protein [Desulfoluna spongiiphila]|uniref:GDP-L-fucose synthase n=1 Tax=Desulfoluna spongiiphila TaxID=419481 RepID=A0A1G5JFK7_9BACT|nr:GDP-L-fucose synthase [Desulfoluna spongiiphila]SCY87146.1 GDP-L-fucose synthase [Desulfoluna spongiiphila]
MNKGSKIYVAGHRGLVGSAIVGCLERDGFNNIVTRTHAELDLTRQDQVEAFFVQARPEYVFLSAAKVGGIMANSTYPAEFIYQNLIIAANVIHSSYKTGVKKLLNLGSSCIYPKLAFQPLKEEYLLTGELEPTNEAYALAKISAIKLCRYYNQQYGTNFISVMPTNLYGPGDNFNLETSHVLPALIRKMHLGKCLQMGDLDALRADLDRRPIEGIDGSVPEKQILSILNKYGISVEHNDERSDLHSVMNSTSSVVVSLWGTGSPFREFLHANDLADACVYLMQKYNANELGEFVNIGTGVDLMIKELAAMVVDVVGYKGKVSWDQTKPDGTPQKLLDLTKLQSVGWKSSISLKDGLENSYKSYVN